MQARELGGLEEWRGHQTPSSVDLVAGSQSTQSIGLLNKGAENASTSGKEPTPGLGSKLGT